MAVVPMRSLGCAGLRHVVVCAGYLGEMIEAEFGDGARFDMRIEYSFDGPHQLGTGGALKRARPLLGRNFFVLYGDSYLPINYREAGHAFVRSEKPALMTVFKNDGRWDTSNVWFDGKQILRYDKKDLGPEMQYIDYGLGVLCVEGMNRWPDTEAFDLADVYHRLAAEKQLAGYEITQRFYEIGSPEGLAELDALLRQ